jgi:hypothetical protein
MDLNRDRVHSHAAAALINFCEGVERDTLVPYLDPIVERLLKLLNPPGEAAKTVSPFHDSLDPTSRSSECIGAAICPGTGCDDAGNGRRR